MARCDTVNIRELRRRAFCCWLKWNMKLWPERAQRKHINKYNTGQQFLTFCLRRAFLAHFSHSESPEQENNNKKI